MKSADKLDHTIEDTFPASDPPANTVVTGVRVGPSAEFVVRDNPEQSRLETEVAGQLATLRYERHPHAVVLVETDVPAALRGRGVANALAKWAIETAERDGLRVVAACPFVQAYMHRACAQSRVRFGVDALTRAPWRQRCTTAAVTGAVCRPTSRCRSGVRAARCPGAG